MKNKNQNDKNKKIHFFEKLKTCALFVVALFMSIVFCIESISNGNLNTFDWVGIGVSAAVIVWWLISIGIFINRRRTEKENRELEQIKKKLAKQSDPNDDFIPDEN